MLTAEQIELRDLAHDFAESELRPHTARWDEERDLDDDVFAKLAELGFLGMLLPEEHGGLGFDLLTYLVVLEELSWGDPAAALAVAIHNGPVAGLIASHGSDEQKAEWLPRMAAGDVLGCFALSEDGAGSDAGSLTTTAEPNGDGWILDGEKRWITNGGRAGLAVVFARAPEGVSAFLVPTGSDGYAVGKRETTLGLRASETVGATLVGLRVGPDALVGTEGAGLAYALEALDIGRLGIGAHATGLARAAVEHAAEYALGREQFGKPIAKLGAIEAKLGEMTSRVAAARALAHDTARWADGANGGAERRGTGGFTARAAAVKLVASEAATWVADEAIQIYGGYGYMRHYPVEKLLRDAKGAEIYEGTNEIMRKVIAREVLRDAQG